MLRSNYNKKLASIETSHRYSPRTRRPRLIQAPYKTKKPQHLHVEVNYNKKLASTYSPGFDPSTIGGAGLNCSVRNGKR
jgi:hypothetical protein